MLWEADIAFFLVIYDITRMHKFPVASEIQFLVGCELQSITLMRWQVHFEFDRAKINVEVALEHIDPSGIKSSHGNDDDWPPSMNLQRLCQQKVKMVSVEPFCLTLAFNGGDIIRIPSEEGPYECGQIYDAVGNITIF